MRRFWHAGLTVLAAMALSLSLAAHDDDEIVIANEMVFRIRVGAAGMSIKERVLEVERRLVDILSYEDLSPPDVQIKGNEKWPAIYVGAHLLVTVTEADAKANQATPMELAKMWADNVRRQLPKAEPLGHLVPANNGAPI